MRFTAKLNKRDRPYTVADEVFQLAGGSGGRYLDHDNVNVKTIEIFTEPSRQGEKVLNYTIEKKDGAEWKAWLQVFAQCEQVYVSYESLGDTVEADDVNELQQAAMNLDAELGSEKQLAQAHRADHANPHATTKAQVGLGNADNTADLDKPVSRLQGEAIGAVKDDLTAHAGDQGNPHAVTKEQVGLGAADNTADIAKPVSTAQAAAIEAVRSGAESSLAAHSGRQDNPHGVTKAQAGLGNVDNVQQAAKADFDSHNGDFIRHLTAAERAAWSDKYTRNEVDNKLSALETAIDWKESVATHADIAAAYPNPEDGWTVNVRDTDYTYRYSGTEWIAISANAIPKATQSVDGLLSKEDKAALDDAYSKRHGHDNKSVLDGITASLVSGWNGAAAHISDAVKHITAGERTLWNTVSGKVDKETGKGLSANDYTAAEKTKLAGIEAGANHYVHPSHPARASGLYKITVDDAGHVSGAAAVAKGDITGLGIPAQDTVYTHPATHPASMITGLAAVAVSGSYNDLLNKPLIPGESPPSGAAGGDLSGTYPNPSVKDNSHAHTIANVTGLQAAMDGKLAASIYTAADVLTKIKTVDGTGSGLDADLLDGLDSKNYVKNLRHSTAESHLTLLQNPKTAYAYVTSANPTQAAALGLGNVWWHIFYMPNGDTVLADFGANGYGYQVAYALTGGVVKHFERTANGTAWSPWKQVLTTAAAITWNQLKGV